MKPTEAEIAWCLANREFVMQWLEPLARPDDVALPVQLEGTTEEMTHD